MDDRLSPAEMAFLNLPFTGDAAPDNAQTYEDPRPTVIDMTPAQAAEVADLFPETPVPYRPLGRFVVVQDRLPRQKTRSGIILSDVSRDEDMLKMNIGRVAAIGPRAFTDEYGNPVEPEFAVGDFVRVPRYTQDRPVEGKVAWRMVLPENIAAVIVHVDAILR